MLIWLGLNWPVTDSWFLAGLAVSVIVAHVIGDIFTNRPHIVVNIKRYFWLAFYVVVLIIEGIRANIEVAYRVLHPDIPMKPGIVKVKTKIKSAIGLTLLANSITFSTGACAVDIDRHRGYIYVHCMDVESQNIKAATELIAAKFEKIIKKALE
jgi:multicomponent Na+:H+ antiporter subunit E